MDEARRLLDYIDNSPTPFHAIENAIETLTAHGFVTLSEGDGWVLEPGQSYLVTRNGGALIAFRTPAEPTRRFRLIGAHTDSPNLRLKPQALFTRHGFVQLGVEVYGGALYNSWLDRDLGIAGRVVVREDGALAAKLVRFDRPLCRVPQLAVHLDREVNEKGLVLNAQKHLPPVLGLSRSASNGDVLLGLLTEQLQCRADDIASSELMLYALQSSQLGGIESEFVFAPRLDNLAMCHASVRALTLSAPPTDTLIGVALFDNEEVGSRTMGGAASPFLGNTLERACGPDGRAAYLRALSESVFISADMAHALHPNYADRHDEHHHPVINGGPVLKHNSNRRYATDGRGEAWFTAVARSVEVPVQRFVNRSDLACGSTIGPVTAANLGLAVIDIGSAMLSMHSAREMAGSQDPNLMVQALCGALQTTLSLPTGW